MLFFSATSTPATHKEAIPFTALYPQGEFLEPPPRIILTSGCEIYPDFITLVRKPPYSRLESENTYNHLLDFERLCSLFAIVGMTQDTLKWKLSLSRL